MINFFWKNFFFKNFLSVECYFTQLVVRSNNVRTNMFEVTIFWIQTVAPFIHPHIHPCYFTNMSSHLKSRNFTKSPEFLLRKKQSLRFGLLTMGIYKIVWKRLSLRLGSLTMGKHFSKKMTECQKCSYMKTKYKMIWNWLSLRSVSM